VPGDKPGCSRQFLILINHTTESRQWGWDRQSIGTLLQNHVAISESNFTQINYHLHKLSKEFLTCVINKKIKRNYSLNRRGKRLRECILLCCWISLHIANWIYTTFTGKYSNSTAGFLSRSNTASQSAIRSALKNFLRGLWAGAGIFPKTIFSVLNPFNLFWFITAQRVLTNIKLSANRENVALR
jgi:hypothetical protein